MPNGDGIRRVHHRVITFTTGNAARDNMKSRIIPRHLLLTIGKDEELGKLLSEVTIDHDGVLPNINFVLLPKKSAKSTEENAAKSPTKSPNKA